MLSFKRLENENCQGTFDHPSDIANKLQGLVAEDITDHETAKKLRRSLDSSYDTLRLMIKESRDSKSLHLADVMERLSPHEEQQEEKRDLYGSRYQNNHAPKAAVDSSSDAENNVDEDSDDPNSINEDLVQITKHLQCCPKKNYFPKKNSDSNSKSSSRSKSSGE